VYIIVYKLLLYTTQYRTVPVNVPTIIIAHVLSIGGETIPRKILSYHTWLSAIQSNR